MFDEKKLREAAVLVRSKNTIANKYDDAGSKLAEFVAEMTDDQLITREWLVSVGFLKDEHPQKFTLGRDDALSIGLWIVDDGWKAMLIHHEGAASCIVRGITTRGDVNCLLFALSKGTVSP